MGLPTYDTSAWPLVLIIAPSDAPTDEEMHEHLRRVAALYDRSLGPSGARLGDALAY